MFKLSNILLSPKKVKRHPLEVIFVGFFYTSISLLLSLWVFPTYASLLMVCLTAIATIYIVQGVLLMEENEEENIKSESSLLKQHAQTLWFFMLLFLGFLLAFVFWTIVLPQSTTDVAFDLQKSSVSQIQALSGNATAFGDFSTILGNNLRVLFFSLIFALFYGAGATFILAWNASIMGYVIGNVAKNTLGLSHLPLVFMKYFIHGIPEMLAYFAAALAGGILFMAVVRGDLRKEKLKRLIIDVIVTTLIAIVILVIAALLETYVSPLL